ncbi:hypothetical protein [Haloferula sp. A504]|uniref:hypothetical protein n=1 Tax=Haloferula sp. A504 TaxID=3373601 RepID=UPI0031C290FB|nr:hypothetical protein [Verrucomicrobiaceae bacterium E54]
MVQDFRFAEVELLAVTRLRIVVEFREVPSLLLADEAARFIVACQEQLEAKGAGHDESRQRRA